MKNMWFCKSIIIKLDYLVTSKLKSRYDLDGGKNHLGTPNTCFVELTTHEIIVFL